MPETGVKFAPTDELLTKDDIIAVAHAAIGVGVTHLKITGGEPTVRKDLIPIIAGLKKIAPHDLSMTTNGVLLENLAHDLAHAGLDRITVSWDTMQPDRFARIARGAARDGQAMLQKIQRGLEQATRAGFKKIKINTVVIGGTNDDEVVDFARLTLNNPWTVRFIEYMPLGDSSLTTPPPHTTTPPTHSHTPHDHDATANTDPNPGYTVDNATLQQRIQQALGPLTPIDRQHEPGVGPARVYQLPHALGRIGFISAMSQPFCETCNRLRLTATGELRSCLFDGGERSIWPALRPAPDPKLIVDIMRQCVALKPDVHAQQGDRAMSQLGG